MNDKFLKKKYQNFITVIVTPKFHNSQNLSCNFDPMMNKKFH